jgi:hypothetical protein
LRRVLVALAIGAAVFAASCLLATPVLRPSGMGEEFAAMAADPFALGGNFPHRMLGPLLGYCLGLGGERYWIFHHAVVVVMLALMAGGALARGASPSRAAWLTVALCGAGGIQAYKAAVGYADPLTFTLLIAAALGAAHAAIFWPLILGALLNHELSSLFVPWLVYVRHTAASGLGQRDFAGAVLVTAAYAGFRAVVAAARPTGTWDTKFFLSQASLSVDTLAMWLLLTVVVVISNGPLLIALCWQLFDRAITSARIAAGVFVVGIYGTAIAALDIWRFAGLPIVPIYFAGLALLQRPRGLAVLLVLGGLTMATSDLQFRVFERLIEQVVAVNARGEQHIVLTVERELWPLFAGYLVGLAAMVFLGHRLARTTNRAADRPLATSPSP